MTLTASAGWAQPPRGAILFADAAGNAVWDVQEGGDYSTRTPFASGVDFVEDVCVGPGDEIYASLGIVNEIKVITEGGDVSGDAPFATGLNGPLGLACTSQQILVADLGSGRIVDATAGGDLTVGPNFATGIPGIRDLFRALDGTLWASTSGGEVYDVTEGGDFSLAVPWAYGGALLGGITEVPGGSTDDQGLLLVADSGRGKIVDITAGGPFGALAQYSSPDIRHLHVAPHRSEYRASLQEVFGNFFHFGSPPFPPIATGFSLADLGGFAHVPGCPDDPNEQDYRFCSSLPGAISIREQRAGKEKLKLRVGFPEGLDPFGLRLGNPTARPSRFDVCLYDSTDSLVAELAVDADPGVPCGPKSKPCWRGKRDQRFIYRDPDATRDGVSRLKTTVTNRGGVRIDVRAGNNDRKGQSSLPTGVTADLAGELRAKAWILISDGWCFKANFEDVKRNDASRFDASTF